MLQFGLSTHSLDAQSNPEQQSDCASHQLPLVLQPQVLFDKYTSEPLKSFTSSQNSAGPYIQLGVREIPRTGAATTLPIFDNLHTGCVWFEELPWSCFFRIFSALEREWKWIASNRTEPNCRYFIWTIVAPCYTFNRCSVTWVRFISPNRNLVQRSSHVLES